MLLEVAKDSVVDAGGVIHDRSQMSTSNTLYSHY